MNSAITTNSIVQFGTRDLLPHPPRAFIPLLMRELRYKKLLQVTELIKDWDLECRTSTWLLSLLSQAITKKKKKKDIFQKIIGLQEL